MKSILLAAAFLGSLCWAGTNPYNIIPEPVNVTTTSGTTKNLKIIHEQKVAGLGNTTTSKSNPARFATRFWKSSLRLKAALRNWMTNGNTGWIRWNPGTNPNPAD